MKAVAAQRVVAITDSAVVVAARTMCPYSNATRGNIPVTVDAAA